MSICVVNVKFGFVGEDVIYVGRKCGKWDGSVLGNKFVIGRDGDRDLVVRRYKRWLWDEFCSGGVVRDEVLRLVRLVREGEDVKLGCWCVPLSCHGEVVRDLVLWCVREGK